jgi:hypothetical protein
MNIVVTAYFANRQPHQVARGDVQSFIIGLEKATMQAQKALTDQGVNAVDIRFTVSVSSQSTQKSYVRAEGNTP